MIYIMTQDLFLYHGISAIIGIQRARLITHMEGTDIHFTPQDFLIIDALHNDCFSQASTCILQQILVDKIIILSAFSISRLKCGSPVFFLPRTSQCYSLNNFLNGVREKNESYFPVLSLREAVVLRELIMQPDEQVASIALHISMGTLRTHKYQIMLKLRLRKISHIVNHPLTAYLT